MDRISKKLPLSYTLAIVLFAAAIRFPLLFTAERPLDGDESVVGVMARHIAFQGEHPLGLYGSNYGGGHTVVAHAAAIFFRIFGASDIFINGVTAASSILLAWLTAIFAAALFCPATGLLAGLLIAVSPPFIKASFEANAYMETMCLAIFLCHYFFFRILSDSRPEDGSKRVSSILIFSMLCGLAVWSFEFSALFMVFFALFAFINIRRFSFVDIPAALAGFAFGSLFLWLPTMLAGSAKMGMIDRWTTGRSSTAAGLLERARIAYTHSLPSWFSPNLYLFPTRVPWYSWILFGAAALGIAVLLLESFRPRGDMDRMKWNARRFIAWFPIFFLIVYPAFFFANRHPRYFLPLAPFFAIGLARTLAVLWRRKNDFHRRTALFILVALPVASASIYGLRDAYVDRSPTANVNTDQNDIVRVIHFLESKNYRGAYSQYYEKWRIAFYSNERIISASGGLDNLPRYMPYELKVREMEKAAYVLPSESGYLMTLRKFLDRNRVERKEKRIGRFIVVYDLDAVVQPGWILGKRLRSLP